MIVLAIILQVRGLGLVPVVRVVGLLGGLCFNVAQVVGLE